MLKINLSDEEGKKKEIQEKEETLVQPTGEIPAKTVSEKLVGGPVEEKKKRGVPSPLLIILLLIIAIAAVVYFQRDKILSLLPKRAEKVEPVPAPPPPPPEPEIAPKEPDPTFVALNKISEIIPRRVWISSAIIKYDGTYEIKGIAFSHSAAGSLGDALGGIGNVTAKNIPKKSKLSETVYNFSVNGAINDINVPEILDMIPTDDLVALAEPVVDKSKEFEVKFNRLPKSGQSYSDKDLPFVLEGSYEGLKKVIAELCPVDGDIRVYQIVILPATTGRPFDKVKASFSLRTISSI